MLGFGDERTKPGWTASEVRAGQRVISKEEAERKIKAKSPFWVEAHRLGQRDGEEIAMTQDVLEGMQRQMAEQTAAAEAAHKANVETFTRMWLGLGSDVLRLAGTMHDGEIAEAKGLAAARWNGLVGMEGQIQREEATLAIRPSRRPTQPGDDVLPDRTLKQRDAEWQDKTKYLRDSLAALKAEAATERRLLESYITKAR